MSPPGNHASPTGRERGMSASKRPAPRGTASYPRKRAVTACQVCRARRTKCDNLKPSCSFCLKIGAACNQSPVDFSSFDPASLKILERLDDVEGLLRSFSGSSDFSVASAPHVGIPETQVELPSLLPPSLEDILRWHIFEPFTSSPVPVIQQWDHGSRIDPRSPLNNYISSPGNIASMLADAPQQINGLVDDFFNYVHVKNPVLSERSCRQMVSSVAVNGIDWTSASCLTLLVCALGSISAPFSANEESMPGKSAYINAQAFFAAAEKRLGMLFGSDEVIGAQCLFLSGVYMMYTFQPKKAWKYFLGALAICQDFITSPTAAIDLEISELPEQENQSIILQQAIYWSSWKSERELRTELNLPDFALGEEDRVAYPTFFPTPPLPDTSYQDLDIRAAREATSWYFYLAEISLRRLAARIRRDMLPLSPESSSSAATLAKFAAVLPSWDGQVRDWASSLPAPLSLSSPSEQDDVCRFILRGQTMNVYETMYWPFISIFTATQSVDFSVVDARIAQLATKGFNIHSEHIRVNVPGFKHRHHGTFLMIRSCTRSAFVLVAFALLKIKHKASGAVGQVPMPAGWRQQVLSVLDLLRYWESEHSDIGHKRHILEAVLAVIDQSREQARSCLSD